MKPIQFHDFISSESVRESRKENLVANLTSTRRGPISVTLRLLGYTTVESSKVSLHKMLTGCTNWQEFPTVTLLRCMETLPLQLALVASAVMNSVLLKNFLKNMGSCTIAMSAAAFKNCYDFIRAGYARGGNEISRTAFNGM